VYAYGRQYSTNYYQLVKFDSIGTFQWQRQINLTSTYGFDVATDTSGNVYIAFGRTTELDVMKLNSSGTIQWQKKFTGWNPEPCYDINVISGALKVDSSGNVYVFAYPGNQSTVGYQLLKLDSTGAITWARKQAITGIGFSDTYVSIGITLDSSDNVYLACNGKAGAAYNRGYLIKYNSSGTFQWQTYVGYTLCGSFEVEFRDVATDSAGNVYVVGPLNSSSQWRCLIVKYNSSGTLQWVRRYLISSRTLGYGISIDSSDNIYVTGVCNQGGLPSFLLKYNTSGTLQWAREMKASASGNIYYQYISDVAIGINKNPVVVSYAKLSTSTTDDKIFVYQVPADGSATGTFTLSGVPWTYSISSGNDDSSTTGLNYGTTGVTSSTFTPTISTPTYTATASSLTTASKVIP